MSVSASAVLAANCAAIATNLFPCPVEVGSKAAQEAKAASLSQQGGGKPVAFDRTAEDLILVLLLVEVGVTTPA